MASVSSAGIGSGLDISGIVSQLVAAERAPALNRLFLKEANLQAVLSGMGGLKSTLSLFKTSAETLADSANFEKLSAASSDSKVFTASADSTASSGVYQVEVVRIATQQKMISAGDFTTSDEADTLNITVNGDAFTIDVTAGQTIEEIRDAINNAADNTGMSATIINVDAGQKLVFTADNVGETISVTTATPGDGNLDQLTTGTATTTADPTGLIKIDGQDVTVTSNTVTGVLDGVTFTLKDDSAGEVLELSVTQDTASVKGAVSTMVAAYNSVVDTIQSLSGFDAATGKGSLLQGDATILAVQRQLRSILNTAIPQGDPIKYLSELGITTNDKGKLTIDSETLTDALDNNMSAVQAFFSTETDGFAVKIEGLLDNYLKTGGVLESRTDSVDSQIKDLAVQSDRLNRRMVKLEARLLRQFSAMDAMVARLNSIGTFLTQQLANLPKIGDYK